MLVNIENKGTYLHVSHFSEEGKIEFTDVPINSSDQFVWEKCSPRDTRKSTEFETWDKKPIKKIKTQRYDKYRTVELLMGADEELTKPFWDFQNPNKYFVDIEVEMTDEMADSLNTEAAKNKVLSIGIGTDKCKMIVLGLVDLTDKQKDRIKKNLNKHFEKFGDEWTFQYQKFESEYDMLYTFFKQLGPKMAVITGWNWFGYDWPYLINRCAKIGIDPKIISPARRLMGKNQTPMHLLMVDYLEIYKKWDRTIKIKESNRLDYVGEKAVGLKKIEYEGSLRDLYNDDKEKFMFYNAVDCALLHYIDQKLKTMTTLFKIAQLNKVEIDRSLSPVWATEVMMLEKFLERGQTFTQEDRDQIHVKFTGGYVKEPTKGLHEWVACYDFASLYPNTMVQWGISPEVYKGKNVNNPDPSWVKSSSGAYFADKEKDEPILRVIIKDLYSKRKKAKKEMLGLNSQIDGWKKELEELEK